MPFQNLKWIELINDLILEGAFQPDFLANFDIPQPVRIPKAFASEPDRPYHIPWHGEERGRAFLAERARRVETAGVLPADRSAGPRRRT